MHRPPLDPENCLDSFGTHGVTAQSEYSFGGKNQQFAVSQGLRGFGK
jgi:hypothetical protein